MGFGLGALTARFDGAALRAYAWPLAVPAPQVLPARWDALRSWCVAGLSAQPFAHAFCHAPEGSPAAWRAAALALELDGSGLLQVCTSPLQRWRLRLRVKLQDAVAVWPLEDGLVWDSGFVPAEPAAWQALMRFVPRRPTFIVMQGLPPNDVAHLLGSLSERSAGFSKPVRVLVLALPGSAAPAGATYMPA